MKDAAGNKTGGALGNTPGSTPAIAPGSSPPPPGASKNFSLAIGYKVPDSFRLKLGLAPGLAPDSLWRSGGRVAGKRSYFLVRRRDVRCP